MSQIREIVDRYLEFHRELRSENWTNSNGYVLRRFATEIVEIGCLSIQEICTANLQSWFYMKARLVKVQTAAAYLFHIQHFLDWCIEKLARILSETGY